MTNPVTLALKALVKIYQYTISPYLPASCRYYPTCSSYALQALETHGPFKGSMLTLGRLGRCHPFGGHGYDPVPAKDKNCHHCGTEPSGHASIE